MRRWSFLVPERWIVHDFAPEPAGRPPSLGDKLRRMLHPITGTEWAYASR